MQQISNQMRNVSGQQDVKFSDLVLFVLCLTRCFLSCVSAMVLSYGGASELLWVPSYMILIQHDDDTNDHTKRAHARVHLPSAREGRKRTAHPLRECRHSCVPSMVVRWCRPADGRMGREEWHERYGGSVTEW
jgi:hypothetical protein